MADDNAKPMHAWAGDDDGHNCAECPDGSIWRCDRLAHFDVEQMIADVNAEIGPDLERMARQRRTAGGNLG